MVQSMPATRHILSSILILVLLSSGMPLFSPEDASRDNRIDLRDAILQVKGFATSAEMPGTFAENMERVISTLNIVVGYTCGIQPPRDKTSSNTLLHLDPTYLVSSSDVLPQLNSYSIISQSSISFRSVLIAPKSPPPRFSFV